MANKEVDIDALWEEWQKDPKKAAFKWGIQFQSASQEANAKAAKDAGDLQKKLRQMQDAAENKRTQAEIKARVQISSDESAAAMARLEKELEVRREDIDARLKISADELGFNREKLSADLEIERGKLAQARDELERVGIPKMEADRWYQQQQVALAQSAQQIDREKLGLEREKVDIDRGRLGYDMMKEGIALANTPKSRYQFADFAESMANNPNTRDWLGAAANAAARSGFGPSVDAGTQPISVEQALSDMYGFFGLTPSTDGQDTAHALGSADGAGVGAQSRGMSPQLEAYLRQMGSELSQGLQVADRGASALAPGTIESWSQDQRDEFTSLLNKGRRDPVVWFSDYARTRPYQGNPEQLAT